MSLRIDRQSWGTNIEADDTDLSIDAYFDGLGGRGEAISIYDSSDTELAPALRLTVKQAEVLSLMLAAAAIEARELNKEVDAPPVVVV